MTDTKEVIKGLERCTGDLSCAECPYHEEEYCRRALEQDALVLLRELLEYLEPVSPIITRDIKTIAYCGKCGHKLAPYGYCAKCGKAVKWDD